MVLMKFTLGQFIGAIKVEVKTFSFKLTPPGELIEEVVTLAAGKPVPRLIKLKNERHTRRNEENNVL